MRPASEPAWEDEVRARPQLRGGQPGEDRPRLAERRRQRGDHPRVSRRAGRRAAARREDRLELRAGRRRRRAGRVAAFGLAVRVNVTLTPTRVFF